jgi:hypothetical protein
MASRSDLDVERSHGTRLFDCAADVERAPSGTQAFLQVTGSSILLNSEQLLALQVSSKPHHRLRLPSRKINPEGGSSARCVRIDGMCGHVRRVPIGDFGSPRG